MPATADSKSRCGSRPVGASRQSRSAPASSARTAASPISYMSATARIPSASVMIGPVMPSALTRRVAHADRVAGSGPRAGTTTWAVITESTPHAKGASSRTASTSSDTSSTGRVRWLSTLVAAVAGEVLATGPDARRAQAVREGRPVPGDQGRVGAERPYADHRVEGFAGDVEAGGEVVRDPGVGQQLPEGRRAPLREVDVVDVPKRRVAGQRRAGAHLEAGDVAALLVAGDNQGRAAGTASYRLERLDDAPCGLDVGRVLAEQDDAREAVAQRLVEPRRDAGPGELGEQDSVRETTLFTDHIGTLADAVGIAQCVSGSGRPGPRR